MTHEELKAWAVYAKRFPAHAEAADAVLALLAQEAARGEVVLELREALQGLLDVIAADELVPESVIYMRQARAVLQRSYSDLSVEVPCRVNH